MSFAHDDEIDSIYFQWFFFFISCCCPFPSTQIKYTERIIGNTGRSSTSISQQNLSHFALAHESLDTFGLTYRNVILSTLHSINAFYSMLVNLQFIVFHSFTFGVCCILSRRFCSQFSDYWCTMFKARHSFFSSFAFIYSNLSCFYKLC